MNINLQELKAKLAEFKVYDAWQYAESLAQTILFMNASYALILKVYEHYTSTLQTVSQEIVQQAFENQGKPSALTSQHLSRTKLDIAGYEISDDVFLSKTLIEFFHYARLSLDVLCQIINTALLGDEGVDIEENLLPCKVLTELKTHDRFSRMCGILKDGNNNTALKYLKAFDNYTKHTRTILPFLQQEMFFGNKSTFEIKSFVYKKKTYPAIDAIQMISRVKEDTTDTIEKAISELIRQIPNGVGTSKRYQNVKFRILAKENEGIITAFEYVAFFLEVESSLSELKDTIQVMPLIIKPNGEIYSFILEINEIFISIRDKYEAGIIGVATAKPINNSNEWYRAYQVRPCDSAEFFRYYSTFSSKYPRLHINYHAMEGQLIAIPDESKQENGSAR